MWLHVYMKDSTQPDFFVIDLADVAIKDDMATMEHPFYSLATRPDNRHLVYETENERLEITPSGKGLPTIFDKDVLIFCISKLMHAKNMGEPISKTVRFNAYEMLKATGRETGGVEYKRLEDCFTRLRGTTFKTNIQTGKKATSRLFGLVDEATFEFKVDKKMRLDYCEVVLSDWVMRSIEANEVVTISPDYFKLRKPLERRIYEIARKHCGNQPNWRIGLKKLRLKTGSNSTLKMFRFKLRKMIEADNIPFYRLELDEGDNVIFRPRSIKTEIRHNVRVSQDALERGHAILKEKGWDSQAKAQEWQAYAAKVPPEKPDGAFIGWCNKQKNLR
jgi:plasmid replication initiation protein